MKNPSYVGRVEPPVVQRACDERALTAAVGKPHAVFERPRMRSFGGNPHAGVGARGCARRGPRGTSTPGFGTRSPARARKPQSVRRQANRYSARVPRGDMFEPVPALAPPVAAEAKTRVARMRSAAGMSALFATNSGVKGST